MKEFEFRVTDENGVWGDMRIVAADSESAERAVRADLEREEVEPNGSLLAEFALELIS